MERSADLSSLSRSEAQNEQADGSSSVPVQQGFTIQSQAHLEALLGSFMARSAQKELAR